MPIISTNKEISRIFISASNKSRVVGSPVKAWWTGGKYHFTRHICLLVRTHTAVLTSLFRFDRQRVRASRARNEMRLDEFAKIARIDQVGVIVTCKGEIIESESSRLNTDKSLARPDTRA